MVSVAIAGATGRMGRMLLEAARDAQDIRVAAAFDRAEACADAPVAAGVTVGKEARAAIAAADCLIDFTRPEATLAHLALACELGKGVVIGTTGFDEGGRAAIAQAAKSVPVVFAPNMSLGVNAVFRLLEQAAKMLNEGYDVEVLEMHHRHKVDAPSGTALRMGELIATAQGKDFAVNAVLSREGVTGARRDGTIGFATLRGGDEVGEHTVIFAGTGERIEISHRSTSRMSYASGALAAARFLQGRQAGLYDMQDVIRAASAAQD